MASAEAPATTSAYVDAHRGHWKQLPSRLTFDDVIAKLPLAMKAEGFGEITHIKMDVAFKEKIGVDFRRYHIIGACNPKVALAALTADPTAGLLLPCNIAVYEQDDKSVRLGVIDPVQHFGLAPDDVSSPFAVMLWEIKAKLGRVVAGVEKESA